MSLSPGTSSPFQRWLVNGIKLCLLASLGTCILCLALPRQLICALQLSMVRGSRDERMLEPPMRRRTWALAGPATASPFRSMRMSLGVYVSWPCSVRPARNRTSGHSSPGGSWVSVGSRRAASCGGRKGTGLRGGKMGQPEARAGGPEKLPWGNCQETAPAGSTSALPRNPQNVPTAA